MRVRIGRLAQLALSVGGVWGTGGAVGADSLGDTER